MFHDATPFSLNRRQLLLAGAAALIPRQSLPSTPSCTLVAEQEVGPYYIDDEILRPIITEGKPGVPLKLRVALVDARRCAPLANAALDIWHCDALGVYSGFTNNPDGMGGPGGPRGPGPRRPGGFGPPPGDFGPPPARQTDSTRFLRGVQLTTAEGIVEFETLYPGWYFGRAIHIHMKVHLGGGSKGQSYAGGHVAHTGQFFFPEEVTADIAKLEPYSTRLKVHRTLQTEDDIFTHQHGSSSMLNLTRLKNGSDANGFLATATLAVDPEATPAPVGRGGPGPRRPY